MTFAPRIFEFLYNEEPYITLLIFVFNVTNVISTSVPDLLLHPACFIFILPPIFMLIISTYLPGQIPHMVNNLTGQ